ncbi:MAG: nitroreductase family protein [Porticoccus sp.]|jgi:nitroreductase|uniref:nitroreductase family protein n=1 Tax=Porticoccus sp. TaxID=2024853 RepID=UPI003298F8A2|tara:strand:- start:20316 stop:20873 length:558 start_codon:yes stop_codon:yes gene_type:complete
MDALQALHQRVSAPRLSEPAPKGDILANIQRAAFRAADHARMRPWRFLIIEGEGRQALGELFVRSEEQQGAVLSDKARQRIAERPLRAPMVMVVIASPKENPKVPEIEQWLSAGAAAQNMITAAYAQGIGAVWRTGDYAYDPYVMAGLGLSDAERIIGFLYLGTVQIAPPEAPETAIADYFQSWP